MARIETELMEGWKFAWNERSDEAFSPVELPHDWAVGRPFDRNMEEGGSQGFRSRFGVGWYRKELTVEDAELWSAEEPNLYLLTLSLLDGDRIADRISLRIGLRTIEMIPGKGMYVNGTHTKIKGVCLYQDVGCLGIAANKEIFKKRLLALKEMGCNAIRPAHYTFSSDFLDFCDEMGFYVYEECFDKWHGGLYGRYFQTEWQSAPHWKNMFTIDFIASIC